jgi:hypothetical protein
MKLRLVLFSSCTLLFSSLSSLSLNAQQEREARPRVTTALPALSAKDAKPEFGPNVLIFDPAMPSQAIQKQIESLKYQRICEAIILIGKIPKLYRIIRARHDCITTRSINLSMRLLVAAWPEKRC